MHAQLDALIKLQVLDCKLADLERSKGDLPRIVEELTSQEQALLQKCSNAKAELQNLEKQKRQTENEARLTRDRLAKFQKQLYEVKTNKEYDAVTLEIDSAKELIDNKEYSVLEIEEKTENLTQELTTLTAEIAQLQVSLNENLKVLNEKLAETNTLKEQLLGEREKTVQAVPRPLLSMYERIRPARNGQALAVITNGACSACHSRIPSQRSLEVRTINDIFTCEVCGRILVWEESRTSFCD